MILMQIGNFLESSIIVLFLTYFFNLKKRYAWWCIALIYFEMLLIKSDETFFLEGLVVLTLSLYIRILNGKFQAKHLLAIILVILTDGLCGVIGSINVALFDVARTNGNQLSFDQLDLTFLFSELFFSLILYLFYCQKKSKEELNSGTLKSLFILEGCMLYLFWSLIYLILFGKSEILMLIIIASMILLSVFLIAYLKKIMNQEKKIKILEIEKQRISFIEQNQHNLEILKNEFEYNQHHLLFMLMHCKEAIQREEKLKACQIIDEQITYISKFSNTIMTKNNFFDMILNTKLNNLWLKGREVKAVINISEDECYDQSQFVEFISTLLDLFDSVSIYSKCIELYIQEDELAITINFYTTVIKGTDMESLLDGIVPMDYIYKLDQENDFVHLKIMMTR